MERFRYDTWQTKEPETIAWIDSFADGDVFFDVGANIGIYSLYCAAVHPSCRTISFEPHEGNFNRLLDNIMLNDFGKIITPSRFIIAEESGKRDFIGYSNEVGSSGGQMVEPTRGCNALCRSIDDLVFFSFDFPQPNHVKIDIDGQDLSVVRGMEKVMQQQNLKSVLVEIDLTVGDGPDIMAAFENNGFTVENQFNIMQNHSRVRRMAEGINVVNVVFTRS